MTKIIYYLKANGEDPIKDFINSLQKQQKSKIFRIFQYVERYGLVSVLPHVKKLTGTPFWEIRILGQDNMRILYVAISQNGILLVNGFVKKKQKTPIKEIEIATARMQDWLSRNAT